MKANEIITASELTSIIAAHGADTVSVDGSMPEFFSSSADLDLDGSETFRVVLNYGHEVQFHLISEDLRAIVTTGLKGQHNPVEGWVA